MPDPATGGTREFAVGSWSCTCGVTKWSGVRGSLAMFVECVYCGDKAEICPEPPEGATSREDDA